jgi:hypothetical protein
MRKLIAAAAGAAVLVLSALPTPTPALALGVTCTYTGPIDTAEYGTIYYVTRRVSKPNGGYVQTLTVSKSKPKNCAEGTTA